MAETSQSQRQQQKRWPHSNLLPFVVAIVVVAAIGFLTRVDLADKAAAVEHWTSSYLGTSENGVTSSSSFPTVESVSFEDDGDEEREDVKRCMDWLEREDKVPYSRDFGRDPILVAGMEEDRSSCAVGCKFGFHDQVPDAILGLSDDASVASVLRSMESSHYYEENNIDIARRRGYKIIMTTSLSSDVPVGYFSWTEYDIMAPPLTKSEDALAAAFISNCGGHNFRLQALEMLESLNIKIDSYGSCHRNRDGDVNKVETLKRYKFSLAFENSNEEDYVTEKFFQSLVAGAVPVVIGAPNIQDFAPSTGSVLHIKELADVSSVAKIMKQLAVDPNAYNQTLMWKYKGPSDSFKALVDMAAVHSSCRLCIHLATKIHEIEERNVKFQQRPCHCKSSDGNLYHLFVRERGRFQFESIYLRSDKLTLKALHSAVLKRFVLLNHIPVWKNERPESIRGDNLRIYRIYPVGITQRQALYTFQFKDDTELKNYVQSKPCAKLEVIFV